MKQAMSHVLSPVLVGTLLACLAPHIASAAGLDTLTAASFGFSKSTYTDFSGVVGERGSPAVYAGNAKVYKGAISLTKDLAKATGIVSTNSGGNFSAIAIHWDSSAVKGRTLEVLGSATPLTSSLDLYCTECATVLATFTSPESGNYDEFVYAGSELYPYIGLRAKSQVVALSRFDIAYDGTPLPPVVPFSYSFKDGELILGDTATITAHPNSTFGANVDFAWFRNGASVALEGDTFSFDPEEAADALTVSVIATDQDDPTVVATNTVTFSVVTPYSITYATNAFGTLSGPATAIANHSVTVTVVQAEGYVLSTLYANGEPFEGNVFNMPATNVVISADFAPLATGDTFDNADVGRTSSTYAEWTKNPIMNKPSGSHYLGYGAGGAAASPCIQFRETDKSSGLAMSWNGGKNPSQVSVVWNAKTGADATLYVYGSHQPYLSPADLFDRDLQGVNLGSIVNGSSSSLEISGYAYIGIRTKSSSPVAYLDKIVVTYGTVDATPAIAYAAAPPKSAEIGDLLTNTFLLNNAQATAWTVSAGEVDAETGLWTWTPEAATNGEVVITATYDGGTATRKFFIDVTDPSSYPTYVRVDDLADLTEGDYLIVATVASNAYAMGEPSSSGTAPTYAGTPVEPDAQGVIRSADTNLIWHLKPLPDGSTDGFLFYSTAIKTYKYAGYKAAYAKNNFYAWSEDAIEEEALCDPTATNFFLYWNITPSPTVDGDAVILNLGVQAETGGSSNRYARFDTSKLFFTTATSASGNAVHSFYQRGLPPEPVSVAVTITNFVFTPADGTFRFDLDNGTTLDHTSSGLQYSTNLLAGEAGWSTNYISITNSIVFIRAGAPD